MTKITLTNKDIEQAIKYKNNLPANAKISWIYEEMTRLPELIKVEIEYDEWGEGSDDPIEDAKRAMEDNQTGGDTP